MPYEAPEVEFGLIVPDAPLRFMFQSTTKIDDTYMVDLAEYDLSGKCSCPHFEFRIEPMLRRGLVRPNTHDAWCKHIRKAREMIASRTIQELAKLMGEPDVKQNETNNPY